MFDKSNLNHAPNLIRPKCVGTSAWVVKYAYTAAQSFSIVAGHQEFEQIWSYVHDAEGVIQAFDSEDDAKRFFADKLDRGYKIIRIVRRGAEIRLDEDVELSLFGDTHQLKLERAEVDADIFRSLCIEMLSIFDEYDEESKLAGIFADLKAKGNIVLDTVRKLVGEKE